MSTNGVADGSRHGVLWPAVLGRIENLIAEQGLGPGDRLPTEAQLADDLGVNRHTVRKALRRLEERGQIEARQGRGRFLRLPAIRYQIGKRPRFSDILNDQHIEPSTRLLRLEIQSASEPVARALSLRTGSKVIVIERLGLADDSAISIATHYLGQGRFPGFPEAYRRHHSIAAALRECGVRDYFRVQTRISSRLPTAEERRLLGLPRHVAVIVTRATNIDSRGWPVEWGEARFASDRVELEISNSRP